MANAEHAKTASEHAKHDSSAKIGPHFLPSPSLSETLLQPVSMLLLSTGAVGCRSGLPCFSACPSPRTRKLFTTSCTSQPETAESRR